MSRARDVADFNPSLFADDEISGDKVSGGTIGAGTFDGTIGSSATVQAGSSIPVLLATSASSNNTAYVDFDSSVITDSFRTYRLCINCVIPQTDLVEVYCQFSLDNGSNIISSGIVSRRRYHRLDATTVDGSEKNENVGFIQIGTDLGNAANEGFGGYIDFFGIRSTDVNYAYVNAFCVGRAGSDPYWWDTGCRINKGASTAINFIRFKLSVDHFAKHDVSFWGYK